MEQAQAIGAITQQLSGAITQHLQHPCMVLRWAWCALGLFSMTWAYLPTLQFPYFFRIACLVFQYVRSSC